MNETNLPETQLSSWRPRRPSAGLKRRIFNHAHKFSARTTRWLWGTLTPTMACLLLTLCLLNSSNSVLHPKTDIALILSNHGNALDDGDGGQTTQNHLSSVTFDWTNHSVFNSSIRFTPTTNSSN